MQPTPMPDPQTPMPDPQPDPVGETNVRAELLSGLSTVQEEPDIAATLYAKLGLDNTGIASSGVKTMTHLLQPGDLVGWYGGQEPDGRYIGNLAVYAGDREIIEATEMGTRRRKLAPDENTFGIPVVTANEQAEQPTDPGLQEAPQSPEI